MRANTGGHAVVLPCPQCARRWSTEQTLAGHLMDAHGMDASPAVARAMQVAAERGKQKTGPTPKESDHEPPPAPTATEETRPMAIEDGVKVCSFCKHRGHVYAECSGAKAHREKWRKAGPKMASANGFASALAALRAERGELDQAITALERLEARGR